MLIHQMAIAQSHRDTSSVLFIKEGTSLAVSTSFSTIYLLMKQQDEQIKAETPIQSNKTTNLEAVGNNQSKTISNPENTGPKKLRQTLNMLDSIIAWRQEQSWTFKVKPCNLHAT